MSHFQAHLRACSLLLALLELPQIFDNLVDVALLICKQYP